MKNKKIDWKKILLVLFIYFIVQSLIVVIVVDVIGEETANLIALLVSLVIFTYMYWKELKRDLKEFAKNYRKYLLKIVIYLTILVLFSLVYKVVMNLIFSITDTSNNQNIITMFKNNPIPMIILVVLVGPIVEELVFRLTFKKYVRSKNLYYVLSIIFFTLPHLASVTNFQTFLIEFPPYAFLGFMFAKIYYDTNNIHNAIILHILNNLIATISFYIS